jgi:hypothetical protein
MADPQRSVRYPSNRVRVATTAGTRPGGMGNMGGMSNGGTVHIHYLLGMSTAFTVT